MAEKYPKDRFDAIPDDLQRVGAHRAPRPRGRGWIAFGWAALATVLLVGLGVFGLSLVNGSISFHGTTGGGSPTATRTATPTPSIVPTVNPALTVNILNGTATEGLGAKASAALKAAGWKIGAVANADQTDLKETVVYYSDAKNEAAALGVAKSLPKATVQETQDFVATGADITVVLGSDYTG